MTYKNRAPFPSAGFVESQRNFTYFDKSLTSGLSDVTIESPGDFLYIDQASTGYVYVELNQRQSGTLAPILLAAGGSIECDFASVKLSAPAQLNKSVRVVIGNGGRIKGGANVNAASMSVSVVDGQKLLTDSGKTFSSVAGVGASVGNYGHVQMWNPSTSGITSFVSKILMSSTVAGTIRWGYYNTACTSLSSALSPKKASGSNSSTQMRYQTNGTNLLSSIIGGAIVSASQQLQIDLKAPIQIPAGYGLCAAHGTTNADLTLYVETEEQ